MPADLIELEIHPSDLNSAALCPYRIYEDLKENKPSYDLTRGSLVHDLVLADHNGGGLDTRTRGLNLLADEFTDEDVDWVLEQVKWDVLIGEAERAFNDWKTHVEHRLAPPVYVETEFRRSLDVVGVGDQRLFEVILVGSPDRVDEDNTINDWKTAAQMWDPVKITGQFQPPAYAELVFGMPVRFVFWIYSYKELAWHPLSLVPTEAQMAQMREAAVKLAVQRHLGLLVANPGVPGFGRSRGWWCSPKYCESWNRCEARKLTNDGNEATVRDWKESWQ